MRVVLRSELGGAMFAAIVQIICTVLPLETGVIKNEGINEGSLQAHLVCKDTTFEPLFAFLL